MNRQSRFDAGYRMLGAHKIEATKEPDSPDIQPRNPGHLNTTPMRGLLSSSWRPSRTGTQKQSLRARAHTHTHTVEL